MRRSDAETELRSRYRPAGRSLQHHVQRVVLEQVALLDIGGERGAALVPAELL